MKTYSAKPNEVKREWLEVDADGKTLGRLAVEVTNILRDPGNIGDVILIIDL